VTVTLKTYNFRLGSETVLTGGVWERPHCE